MIQLKTIIPTFVLEQNEKIEDIKAQHTFYVIASNGFFLKQKQDLFESISKVSAIPGLSDVKEFTDSYIPRIPLGVLNAVTRFFELVYDKHKSEAVVILHFSPTDSKWHVEVPEQEVGSASADYDRKTNRRIPGFIRIGTIHSHASMAAFHSGVDDKDEENFDGIHITIGNLDSEQKSFSARLMCVGKSTKLEPINLLNDDLFELPEIPKEWMDNVKEKVYSYQSDYYGRGYGCRVDDDFFYGAEGYGGRAMAEFYRNQRQLELETQDFESGGKKRSKVISKSKAKKGMARSFIERFKTPSKAESGKSPTQEEIETGRSLVKSKGEIY